MLFPNSGASAPFSRKNKVRGWGGGWLGAPAVIRASRPAQGYARAQEIASARSACQRRAGEAGVPVSVSLRAGLALARARSPPLPASGSASRSSSGGWELPLDPAPSPSSLSPLEHLLPSFCPFQLGEGPGRGARVDRTPSSAPPYAFAPLGSRGAEREGGSFTPTPFFFNTPLSLIDS